MHNKYLQAGAKGFVNYVTGEILGKQWKNNQYRPYLIWTINIVLICRKTVFVCILCFKAKPIISSQLMDKFPKD